MIYQCTNSKKFKNGLDYLSKYGCCLNVITLLDHQMVALMQHLS